jgi:hypothetical protein
MLLFHSVFFPDTKFLSDFDMQRGLMSPLSGVKQSGVQRNAKLSPSLFVPTAAFFFHRLIALLNVLWTGFCCCCCCGVRPPWLSRFGRKSSATGNLISEMLLVLCVAGRMLLAVAAPQFVRTVVPLCSLPLAMTTQRQFGGYV